MKKYKKRLVTQKLHKLFRNFPVVIVTGARQVGKSTLLQHEFGKAMDCVVFDPVQDIGNARQDPGRFLDNNPSPIILDEIQYAPELVSHIKRRIDETKRNGQYILTGSQQWEAMKHIAESLAGRAVFIDLKGFSLREISPEKNRAIKQETWLEEWLADPKKFIKKKKARLKTSRTLYEQLWRGFLPRVQTMTKEIITDFHEGYFRTYVERDIRLLTETQDLQTFNRFIKLIAALTAQEINFSELGREIGINPQTAKKWLNVIEGTFQWFSIPAFSGNMIKRVSNKPKGYFADTGLICNAQAISSPKALGGHPLLGAVFETAVVTEILKLSAAMTTRANMYHWRVHSGAEVDVILEKDGIHYPIEIKIKSNPSGSDTRGITAFRERYPKLKIAPGLVLCPCDQFSQLSDNDYALPWDSL